jgi:hypothetical protein
LSCQKKVALAPLPLKRDALRALAELNLSLRGAKANKSFARINRQFFPLYRRRGWANIALAPAGGRKGDFTLPNIALKEKTVVKGFPLKRKPSQDFGGGLPFGFPLKRKPSQDFGGGALASLWFSYAGINKSLPEGLNKYSFTHPL